MDFTNTVVIRRPPGDVFRFLAELENIPKWNSAIIETHKTEEAFEVTEFEPERRLAIRGGLGPLHGTMSYTLEPMDQGTRLTNAADLEGRGVLRIAAPLATGRIREAVAANLGVLKELLEARAAHGGQ